MRCARCLAAPALVAALAVGATAHAEIYRWTDAEGRLHYTESLARVPPEHREEALRSTLRPVTRSIQTFSSSPDAPDGGVARARPARSHGVVRIPFVREGTLMRVDALLNDAVRAPFLIDTGASGISLPTQVADDLGIRIDASTPHVEVVTAAGRVTRPMVRLDSVEVGGARVEGLEATLNPAMDIGLLGGSFFNNFVYRVDAAEGVITLTPNQQIRGGMGEADWRLRFRSLLDPLAALEAHLAQNVVRRPAETAELERRRGQLEAALEELQGEANRLDVPHAWRQ
jgi:clan AA aspartic protease (TIGR02281 family)